MCFLAIRLLNSSFFTLHLNSFFVFHLLAVSKYFCFVLLDVSDVLLANRDVVLQVEVIIYCTEWQCLLFLEESQTLEELALVLVLAEGIEWLKECLQQ